MAQQAVRSIDILTHHMDPAIYDSADLEQAFFQLVRGHEKARVRILCYDTRIAVANGHALVRQAQNMTSSIAIQQPSSEHSGMRTGYVVIDRRGLITRKNEADGSYVATVNYNTVQDAVKISDDFELMWQHSTPDSQIRRIYM